MNVEYYRLGVKLAFKLAGLPAEDLAEALRKLGPAPDVAPPGASNAMRDPKDPDDSIVRSALGPFSGDAMTSMGLNATHSDYLGW